MIRNEYKLLNCYRISKLFLFLPWNTFIIRIHWEEPEWGWNTQMGSNEISIREAFSFLSFLSQKQRFIGQILISYRFFKVYD